MAEEGRNVSGEFHIQCSSRQGNVANYTIGPLEEGYGRPLGNALRRVLLSSLPGAAVTALRITSVLHEFQELPGALEDVTDLVLNVKQLCLRCTSPHPVSLWLEVSGARRVTVADFTATGAIEIVNPGLYLFTLDSEQVEA